uniref:hypothetical protein n=1 Tax=Streptomyces hawaiiensis TaxID=67305 RepID=UPI0031D989FB
MSSLSARRLVAAGMALGAVVSVVYMIAPVAFAAVWAVAGPAVVASILIDTRVHGPARPWRASMSASACVTGRLNTAQARLSARLPLRLKD